MVTGEKVAPSEEKVEVASEEEKLTPALKEEKAPASEELKDTVTKEEFRKAQSSWDTRINEAKAEAMTAKTEADAARTTQQAAEAKNQDLQSQLYAIEEREAAGDPDTLGLLKRKRDIEAREQAVGKQVADADKQLKYAWALQMKAKALEVCRDTGVDIKELEGCQTEAEMEAKGLKFEKQKRLEVDAEAKEKAKESEETKPKFTSGVSAGGGGRSFTREQIANMSQAEFEAARDEINKARKEGRIK